LFLWFLGGSWVVVWAVLQDPAVDYRLVMLGALLPDVIDAPLGGARVAHTLAGSVVALVIVMAVTVGRRRLRRRLLALPIGMLMHLVLDGVWTTTRVFWWPFRGWSLAHAGGLPSLAHPVALTIGEEIAGAVALGWCWVRFGLGDRPNRDHFLHTGRLPRDAGPPGGTAGLPSPRRRPPGR
jgi:hypothetical protein